MTEPKRLHDLSSNKRALLERMRRARGLEPAPKHPLVRAPADGQRPLSFGQERLWLLDQLEPGSSAYNMPAAVRLRGPLDVAALQRSLREIVRRHQVLRTSFPKVDGHPVQHVCDDDGPSIPVEDLADDGSASEQHREATARRRGMAEAREPFDLARGPLLRARLLRLADEHHVLLLTMHHIVCDGWSIGVLIREAAALYASFSSGQPSPLPPLPIQYADYAHWQRGWLRGETLATQLDYWKNQLIGAATLELPTDRPRPSIQTADGCRLAFEISADLTQALNELSRREGTTLFMTLLAAFDVLLARYTGQQDIVIGTPIANRTRAETRDLIGFFVNTLVVRADLSGEPTFRELLGRIREAALGAYAHQDLPFERLVEELRPERDLSRTPLFQVMFTLQNAPSLALELAGLELSLLELQSGAAKFDLTLEVAEVDRRLAASFEFNRDLFDEPTIARVAKNFTTLLRSIVAGPERRVGELELLDEAERRTLHAWNQTSVSYPSVCIHELFEARVRSTPEATAVVCGLERISYAELERRANQLAWHLQALGVTRESLVAICTDRSIDMIASMVAILKAGGAYVPLDPDYPPERLGFMLADAKAAVVITHTRLQDRLPPTDARRVLLDADWPEIGRAPTHNPERIADQSSLAYVIYTSGSTGVPKGVAIEHKSATALLHWVRDVYTRDELSGVLAATSICFDLSVFEIFAPLSWGGTVVLADNALALTSLPAARDVRLVNTVPSAMAELVQRDGIPSSVITVNLAGEPLKNELVEAVLEAGSVRRVFDLYGPSEDTTYSTFAPRDGRRRPTIGRPIANTRVHLLDSGGQPVPIGAVGEIHLAGDGLARGYLDRPQLTERAFVPGPLCTPPEARIYKTGDLARHLPDGSLEYRGRVDHQVKVRGFRIELGEIEAAIARHPAVQQSLVLVREDVPGDQRLTAYVVPAHDQTLSGAELREMLKARLPGYMVPSAFVELEKLPLTPNGKVDRRALPRPDAGAARAESLAPPRTATEQAIAAIWGEVLRVDQVAVDDDFFVLGGHSLLATRVVARVRSALGVELPLRAVFEAPTLRALAARVEGASIEPPPAELPPIEPLASRDGPLVLSFGQERMWFLQQLDPERAAYNMAAALEVRGPLDDAALCASLNLLVARHEVLRTAIVADGGRRVGIRAPSATIDLPIEDLTGIEAPAQRAAVAAAARAEARLGFDLEAAPLIRAKLLRLSARHHALLVTMHHAASDGWSTPILVREVASAYAALSRGEVPALPELPIQYADYAAWQRAWLQGPALEAQLSYWTAQLQGAPAALSLPTDRVRPSTLTHRGARLALELSPELTERVRTLGRREGVTLFMTLLAAFDVLLFQYSSQPDVVVGSPIANRTRTETEPLVGFFVNTLALRTDLSGNPSFRALLGRVRQTALGAYAHQDLPFERLVEALQPERDLGRTPVFQVMFALQNTPAQRIELGELEITPLDVDGGVTKFDLTLTLAERGDRIQGTLDYNADLFEAPTAERMARHFVRVLDQAARAPDKRISTVELLDDAERATLLSWARSAGEPVPARCVHELFEQQAAASPDAPALISTEATLTYRELNRRANRLARRLRQLGVGPEVCVGLVSARRADAVVALLGILKTGGAYVALDPEQPAARRAQVLRDAAVRVLVVPGDTGWADESGCEAIRVGAEADGADATDDANRPSGASPEHLAYVLYTSGSTGVPKGVAIRHSSVANLWQALRAAVAPYARGEATTVSLNGPLYFDTSVKQWAALLGGHTLCVVPDEARFDARALLQFIDERQLGVLDVTPSQLELLIAGGLLETGRTPVLLVGGEAFDAATWRRCAEASVVAYNVYGPTECTVDATLARVEPSHSMPVLGRALGNMEALVLDGELRLSPVGVPGELYIGGAGLARGYHGRADLTAERFVPHPFASTPGARLYRTGDLARYRADGSLEFLGRLDHQVKLRGFRIELGEIEAALRSQPAVAQAAVLLRTDLGPSPQLVAYVASSAEPSADTDALRAALRASLPDYMVPAFFVVLQQLPLTPRGKLDIAALPAPDRETADETALPRGDIEQGLAAIWSELLGVASVGVHTSFFDLGGHSLLATQLVSRVRSTLGVELPLRAVFEAPTLRALAARVDAARIDRSGRELSRIERRASRDGSLVLSFGQERLWFLEKFDAGGAAYNMPAAVRLKGRLRVDALERSLREIVRRHDVLRTRFPEVDGQPTQVVSDDIGFSLPIEDLGSQGSAPVREREATARSRAIAAAVERFDLARGPLLRARLLRLADEDHVLLFTMHHIVSDGWSIGVLIREAAALYASLSSGQPTPLPELPIQYADYAHWQREWLRGETLAQQVDYWKRHLEGAPTLQLPTDRPRPPIQTFRGRRLPFQLSEALTEALGQLSRRQGATLFMTLLTAFDVLLARYSGQEDVVVGTPIANRTRTETQELIGFFVNTLCVRTDLSGQPTFCELLGRVREAALGAYAHQDLPFERLVEELRPERDLSRAPLFQVMFVMQNARSAPIELAGVELKVVELDSGTAKFDLTLEVAEVEQRLFANFEYNLDLFDEATIARLAKNFVRLLQSIVAGPERTVWHLDLLDEAEQRTLEAWNDTSVSYPSGACIHELFQTQVRSTPDATAVVCGLERITYAQLDRRANQLACHLRKLGVGGESLVAVCMYRTIDMIIAMVAILKAGAAYVPLDPSYPHERLAFMLADSKAAVVVAHRRLQAALPECDARVVLLDADWPEIAERSPEPPDRIAQDGSLAYVIYTSGSTGVPKGVAIEHKSAVALLHWARDVYTREELSGVLASTSICFDLSVFEIFAPLSWGGTVVLADNALALPTLPAAGAVRLVNTVPSAMAELVRRDGVPSTVITVNLAGEALNNDLVRAVRSAASVRRVFDLYGPSEDTTYSTFALRDGDGRPTIGRPITNTRVHLLDRNGRPVPIGAIGEIYLAGHGLARGYLDRPELTERSFVPMPLCTRPEPRAYKTGDLARHLPDGNLEYLGRVDHQVKVRGFRIELGEIEAAIVQHPAVRQSVVLVREDVPGDQRVTAYVVPGPGQAVSGGELREMLKARLPEFMLPSAFVQLEELPLTPNGKLDRRALPAPDAGALRATSMVSPRSPAEEVIAGIWAEVLHLDRVGVEDDFFLLGGHSLLAARLASRIGAAFDVDLPVRAVFEAPTIAALAALIVTAAEDQTGSAAATEIRVLPRPFGAQSSRIVGQGPRFARHLASVIHRAPRDEPPPLSFGQERLWFLEQLDPGNTAYVLAAAVRLKGRLEADRLARCLAQVVRRHEVLRTSFHTGAEGPHAVVHPAEDISVPVTDAQGLAEADRAAFVDEQVDANARTPFDLTRAPLVRARLLRLAEEEHVLLWAMHHIVSDGWSMGVLLADVAALYRSDAPLPELPVQYADYAVWQRSALGSERLASQLSYWTDKLAGSTPLELPTDRPRASRGGYRAAIASTRLPVDLANGVRDLGRQENATVFMMLLSAIGVVLCRQAGDTRDVVIGAPIATRPQPVLEQLVGFFLNTLALRIDASENPSFRELLRRTRETCLEGYAHQDLPFERLVEALAPTRDLGRTPVFQVLVNMLNFPRRIELETIEMELLRSESPGAKFDLTFYAREDEDGSIPIEAVYNADLFDGPRIDETLAQLCALLEQVCREPDAEVERATLVTRGARRVLPEPSMELPTPSMQLVHQEVARWASSTPEAVAVRTERPYSYAELDASSRDLASHLIALGLQPRDAVAIHAPRGFALVTCMLAALRSGAVMVPIDPALPEQRKRSMVRASGARFVIHPQGGSEPLSGMDGDSPSTVRIDADGRLADQDRGSATAGTSSLPERGATPAADDPAYVFFTSGTTGTPKGVLGSHKGLAHFLRWQREFFAVGPDDRVGQLTAISFDVFLRDVFLPLTSGATLCIPPAGCETALADEILPWMERERVTLLHTVPSLAQSWLATGVAASPKGHLRCVFMAGEPLGSALVSAWRNIFPACTVVNLYGPTETTLAKCHYLVPEQVLPGTQPVGTPLPETQALVLRDADALCGIGEPGEIVIRTPFRSLGYLNASAADKTRFFANPFRDDPSDLLYRTGDRGRYRPDGALDILGRLDDQVKIRGIRVEPGEIAATLMSHADVSSAAVVAWVPPGHTDKVLVAYLVGRTADAPSDASLRELLGARLPDFMMPAAFVRVDALPLTPNGKLDRRALPPPELSPAVRSAGAPPRTPTEQVVASIWEQVLRVQGVSRTDGFFQLGGHSLLGAQVVTRIRATFGVDLPLRALFESPTVAGLSDSIDAARQGGADRDQLPPIEPQPRLGALALSHGQERLWFLEQLALGTSTYVIATALRIKGALDVDVLERCLREVVRRHEVLRTGFEAGPDGPRALVRDAAPLEIARRDWSGRSGDVDQALRRAVADARAPFDLSTPPLLRVDVIRLEEREHVAVFAMHHIVSDGWSMHVIAHELAALYDAAVRELPAPLPEPTLQYADYAAWQRRWFEAGTLERQIAFWKTKLAGAPPALELPTDRPRPPIQRYTGSSESFEISAERTAALSALGMREGATLYMTVLAAFDVLLWRLTGQPDVVVGAPMANRPHPDTEGMVGFFISSIALRTDLSGAPTFRELVGRVRETCLEAYAHQDVPFDRLVEALGRPRDLSRTPVFQVFCNMLNFTERIAVRDLEMEPLESETPAAKLDLTLYAKPISTGAMRMSLVYNADLFERARMVEVIAQFTGLLDQIVANPDASIGELSLVTSRAGAALPDPTEPLDAAWLGPVHQVFAQRAVERPEAVAVVDAAGAWTYGALHARSDAFAGELVAAGVRTGDVVAIAIGRSAALVLAVIATMKAGGVFVIVDATYPQRRSIEQLELAQPRVVVELAGEPLRGELATYAADTKLGRVQIVTSSPTPTADIEPHPTAIARGVLEADSPAYVVFTSGSTGEPKGVLGRHGPLSHFVPWLVATFGLGPGDRFTMLSGLAHDPLHRDMFFPLQIGATLVVPAPDDMSSPAGLVEWLRASGATVAHLTPALAQLLSEGTEGVPPVDRLRLVFFGGDVLTREHVRRMRRIAPNATCVNYYGSTETGRALGVHVVDADAEDTPKEVLPIGRGMEDVQLLVLNETGRLAGVGEVGEIHVRSPHLSAGYLRDVELTRRRFLVNPFTGDSGDQIYRTGDFGRYTLEGQLEYLGRRDGQVKIRGYRIETAEVEAALRGMPAVADAAVVLRTDRSGDPRLVGYVARSADAEVLLGPLRDGLSAQLPEYMVPSALVVLDAMPVTATGKIDRAALPAPTAERPAVRPFAAPTSELERGLATCWREVLDVADVGLDDGFFDLGGHSLLLPKLLSKINAAVASEVTMIDLFQHPTVRALAAHLVQTRARATGPESTSSARERGRSRQAARGADPRARLRDRKKGGGGSR